MRLKSLAAAIAALSSFSIAPAFGDDWSESVRQMFPPPCTPRAQRCLEKLSTLIDNHNRSSDSPRTGRGWRDLIETDPECAVELGAGWIY
jgi:hypothetical protein